MADSVMRNIGNVEQYGKNLANISQQLLEIFGKLKQQTDGVGHYWEDDNYELFRQVFDQDIMKKIQEVSVQLDNFAKFVEGKCKIQRMYQSNKYI